MEEERHALDPDAPSSRLAVSVIMERRMLQRGPWTGTQWTATGALVGNPYTSSGLDCRMIRDDSEHAQFLWSGLNVVLHKEDIESYRYNLQASTPSLFILCRADGNQMKPVTVSMNYDDAGRCLETGDTAFAVPLTPEMYQWLERYVAENYVPQDTKKRQKERWSEQSPFGRRPEPSDR